MHCGFTRAKNTTRQIEHLQECQAYLDSPDASAHIAAPENPELSAEETRAVLNGTHPNPNLQINRRGPNTKRKDPPLMPAIARHQQQPQPSLTAHLLQTMSNVFNSATQQPFLSHAGCGTLSPQALAIWMVQDGHYTRAYIQFIGALIAKIRLPTGVNSQFHPMYRTMDLLISALNNIRREMSFFEITATKYSIALIEEPPNNITRAYLDLFASVSSPSSSLLEGMVVLWATEHVRIATLLYHNTLMEVRLIALLGFMPNLSHLLFQAHHQNHILPLYINH
jgi:thiaminase